MSFMMKSTRHASRPAKRLDKDHNDCEEEIELLTRGKLKRRNSPSVASRSVVIDAAFGNFTTPSQGPAVTTKFFTEHKLQSEDTVYSLSLRYRCPINDLKRLNGLIKDQDLFALKTVKIPVSPFGRVNASSELSIASADSGSTRVSVSPTEELENDTRPEKFFSKIDSDMQNSFFWLSAKKPLPPLNDESEPEVVVSTTRPDGYALLSQDAGSFTKASPPLRKVKEEYSCSKCTVFFIFIGVIFTFVLFPLVLFFLWRTEHPNHAAHDIEHNITHNITLRHR